jgi:serine/threonine protein kinase
MISQALFSTGQGVENRVLPRKDEVMADRVGQRFGNYRLLRLLGRGGFAEVYLGQHVRLNMQAAIKVLHTQLADAEVKQFQREAQTIAALLHAHIVRVLDFDVQEGVPFLVMDYAPNGSLRRAIPGGAWCRCRRSSPW